MEDGDNKYKDFKEAYDDMPSQDNEGYTPDRGSFKSGFFRAWELRQEVINALRNENRELREKLKESEIK